LHHIFSFLLLRQPPNSPLFPYTTLFRSDLELRLVCDLGEGAPLAGELRVKLGQRLLSGRVDEQRRDVVRELVTGRPLDRPVAQQDRKSTRLNSSHDQISYAVFCLKKKKT